MYDPNRMSKSCDALKVASNDQAVIPNQPSIVLL